MEPSRNNVADIRSCPTFWSSLICNKLISNVVFGCFARSFTGWSPISRYPPYRVRSYRRLGSITRCAGPGICRGLQHNQTETSICVFWWRNIWTFVYVTSCFTKQDSKSVSKLGEFLACIFSNLSRKLRQSSTSTKSNHRKILMLLGLSWRSNVGGLRPCETWWWWCVWGGAQLERARDSYEDQRLLDAMHKPMLCREWGSWWMSCVTGTQRSGWHRTLTEIFP